MLAKDEEVDAEVTWEDQDNINTFGRLNQRLHEIRDEVKAKRDELQNIQDASSDLLLVDEGPVKIRVGEVFVDLSTEETEQLLQKQEQQIGEALSALASEEDGIQKTLATLKVKLYAKFKNSINLEED